MMLNTGTLNRDEVRALEGWNPMPNGEGQIHLYPVNFAPMSALGLEAQGEENASEEATKELPDGEEE